MATLLSVSNIPYVTCKNSSTRLVSLLACYFEALQVENGMIKFLVNNVSVHRQFMTWLHRIDSFMLRVSGVMG